jgi:hypothetical protein
MLKLQFLIAVLLVCIVCNAGSSSQQKKTNADNQRRNYEKQKQAKQKQIDDGVRDSDFIDNEDAILTEQEPPFDWDRDVPKWRDVKCDRCSGTGITKEVVGNRNPKTKTKICKQCSGKGTRGKTKD